MFVLMLSVQVLIFNAERTVCVQLPIQFDELPDAVYPENKGCTRCVLQLTSVSFLFMPPLLV